MDGLLSLLVFGVLFFVMMRYGRGAHIMHGSHGGLAGQGDARSRELKGGTSDDTALTWKRHDEQRTCLARSRRR